MRNIEENGGNWRREEKGGKGRKRMKNKEK